MLSLGAPIHLSGGAILVLLLGLLFVALIPVAARFARRSPRHSRPASPRLLDEAEQCSRHDALTGLLDKKGLKQDLRERARRNESFALFYIDLDRFHAVNEQCGREGGDRILKSVAQRLFDRCGPDESVARIAADQFVVLAPAGDLGVAANIGSRIIGLLGTEPYLLGEQAISVTASAGLAIYPYHGKDLGPLMGEAETALFQAKCAGGGQCAVVRNKLLRTSWPKQRAVDKSSMTQESDIRGAA